MSKDIRNVAKKLNKELKELGVSQNVRDLVRERFLLADHIHNIKMGNVNNYNPQLDTFIPIELDGFTISEQEQPDNNNMRLTISPSDNEIRVKFVEANSDHTRSEVRMMVERIKKCCEVYPWTTRSKIQYRVGETALDGHYRVQLESNTGKLKQVIQYYPNTNVISWDGLEIPDKMYSRVDMKPKEGFISKLFSKLRK